MSLEGTCKEKSALMQRALKHLSNDTKQQALCLVMGWMSIDTLRVMVAFWDEREGKKT